MKRVLISIILSLALGLSLAACARSNTSPSPTPVAPGQQPPAPVYGGSLVVAIPTDPDKLDPHKAAAAATEEILFNVYEGLLKSDPKGELVPALAESWTIEDGGKLYTFKLRQNVVFHNGKTMTAEDVKFSFDRIRDKATGHPRQSEYQDLVEVKVIDANTVQMRLAKPQAPFLSTLAAVSSAIIPKEAAADLENKP
ncbi:MAG: ABC transporter substrate-binding protein, partial [Bacillota bacterium]